MKTLSNRTEIVKIMSFGNTDFELNLKITDDQAKKYKFDLNQTNSFNDMKSLLENQDIRENVSVSVKNQLLNLLLFMNKTNKNKIFLEYLTLNTLFFGEELNQMKDKAISYFDDYYIQLIETNIFPPNKFIFNVNFNNTSKKSFEIYISSEQLEKNKNSKEEKIQNEEIKIYEISKEGPKKVEPKKEESNKLETKNPETKIEEKKDLTIKEEPKYEVQKKEESIKEEPKKVEEYKNEESTKDKELEKSPKQGKSEMIQRIELPNVEKPIYNKKSTQNFPEGKEDEETAFLNYNRVDLDKKSPIILTKKTNFNNSFPNLKTDNNNDIYRKESFSHLKYDFEACDYIILDLNIFAENSKFTFNDINDYVNQKILQNYLNTSIILIFPSSDKINAQNQGILVDLITISDIVLYEIRDAIKLCTFMGYRVEEKNFEVRFMFLKEFKKSKYKPQKTAMFLDDFNKFTIIKQETESNIIIFHSEYNFNVGFKMEYLNTVTTHFEMLKSAFLGGVLSRLVHNDHYDLAFSCGNQTFKKLLDSLYAKLDISDDPDYFIINDFKFKSDTKQNNLKKNRSPKINKDNFYLDSINLKTSKLKPYDPLKDRSLVSFFNNKNTKRALKSNGIKFDHLERSSPVKTNPLEHIKQEQNKYLTMLEQNQILQKKLIYLMSVPNTNQENIQSNNISKLVANQNYETIYNSRKLPGLKKIDYNPFQKIANAPDYLNETDKKKVNLKPIVKNKDKPNLSENRSTLNMNTINQQMVNMMKFMQQPNSNNASSGDVSPNKDSMAQTMFNPELFNQFMTTMGNSAFNNMKMKSMKPINKAINTHNPKLFNRNTVYPSKNIYNDLYNSFDNKLANQQHVTSLDHTSISPSNEKKNNEIKKDEKKMYELKGVYFNVDNSKPIEQLQYEDDYKQKLNERRKREEEFKRKMDLEKMKKEEEQTKMKNENSSKSDDKSNEDSKKKEKEEIKEVNHKTGEEKK